MAFPDDLKSLVITSYQFSQFIRPKTVDALNQIAYCRVILRIKMIAQGPAYLSSFRQYKIVESEISNRPLAINVDFSVAIFKPHVFGLNAQTLVRKGDSIVMNRTSVREVGKIRPSEFFAV